LKKSDKEKAKADSIIRQIKKRKKLISRKAIR